MQKTLKKWMQFVVAITIIASVWTAFLPWLGAQRTMSSHLDDLDAKEIDGGAMFYTELEAMEPILDRRSRRLSPQND